MIRNYGATGWPRGHVNEMDGSVAGPVVQARDVLGGVHFHWSRETPPIPRQLPSAGLLVDRAEPLHVLGRIPPQGGVVVVSGPAGIGKTALSLHWAHKVLERFPDGQLFLDLQGHSAAGPLLPGEALGRLIRAFGISDEMVPVDLPERAALYRSLTAERRLLIVLDDAYSAAQVRPLLPGTAASTTVVTSRWRLAGLVVRGARGLQLGPLTADAAVDLLGATLGDERVRIETTMAEELVEQCGRSPLALSIAAARLATRPHWSLAAMVRDLAHERRRLEVLAAHDAEDKVTIRAALTLSYRNLPSSVQRLYWRLGLHPGKTFDSRMAAALADVPGAVAEEGLNLLAEANLVEDLPDGRYRFHNLVRLHARDLAEEKEPEAQRCEAVRRLTEWAVVAAFSASQAIASYRKLTDPGFRTPEPPEFGDATEAIDWLDAEFGNLRSLARRAFECGLHRQAWLLVDASWPLFLHRGHHIERLDFDRVGLAAARAAGDLHAEAKMLNRTGLALRQLGRVDQAADDFNAALLLWQRLGATTRAAGTRRRLGLLELDRGATDAAAAQFQAALDFFRSANEDRRAAITLCDLGITMIKTGRPAEASSFLTEAVRLLESSSDPYNHARSLLLLAQAHAQADPAMARNPVERGLAIMREIGSAIGEADALHVLGDLARQDGRLSDARQLYIRARGILAETGAPTRTLDERLLELDDRD